MTPLKDASSQQLLAALKELGEVETLELEGQPLAVPAAHILSHFATGVPENDTKVAARASWAAMSDEL